MILIIKDMSAKQSLVKRVDRIKRIPTAEYREMAY
jgi:hypothetical protein